MTTQHDRRPHGPATRTRALAPDVARGLALIFIALANVMIYLHARPYGLRQHIVEHDAPDTVTTFLLVTFVDGRAYPLFAALFGYGIVRIADRMRVAGNSERTVTAALRRRSLILIAVGFVHAVLAFSGDILGWYGLIGVVIAARTRVSDRTLLTVAAVWLVAASAIQGFVYADPRISDQRSFFWSYAIGDPVEAALWRIPEWIMSPFGLLSVVSAVLVGMWAARRRIIERPNEHRRLLRTVAAVGIPAGVVGGFGMATATALSLQPPLAVTALLSWLHILMGVLAGLGYLAAITLVVANRTPGPIMTALRATGKRSLSAYLAQTLVFAALLPAHTLAWGATLGTASATLLATATWLATVLAAAAFERRDWPGPAERLVSRLRTTPIGRPRHSEGGQGEPVRPVDAPRDRAPKPRS